MKKIRLGYQPSLSVKHSFTTAIISTHIIAVIVIYLDRSDNLINDKNFDKC
jgi:hypothetical protein